MGVYLNSETAYTLYKNETEKPYEEMLQKEKSLGYVYRLAKESGRLLEAALAGDTNTMTEILELVHDTETPLLQYKWPPGRWSGMSALFWMFRFQNIRTPKHSAQGNNSRTDRRLVRLRLKPPLCSARPVS